MRYFYAIAIVIPMLITSGANASVVTCATTIKCTEGRAKCHAAGEDGQCGRKVGNLYRTCEDTQNGEVYICCSKGGEAISTGNKAFAGNNCSSPGVVE